MLVFPNRATILILGSIPPMVPAILDFPMVSRLGQQAFRRGLIEPQTGHAISGFFSVFDDLAVPQRINLAF